MGPDGDAEIARDTIISVVPEARTVAGDLHGVLLRDFAANDLAREVMLWTRAPRDLTMRFGPPPAIPTFRTIATSPMRRVAADFPSQPDYDGSVTLFYYQPSPARSILVSATREYFGGAPATWTLELPDLVGVEGYPPGVALAPGPFTWSLHVTSRPTFFVVPIAPAEGQVLRSADRNGRQN